MKDNLSQLTPKQAASLAGYTPRHIQNLITSGKLSATKEDGKYYIDKAEFFRLFPDAHRKEKERNPSEQEAEKQRLEFENNLLKQVAAQKEAEIDFLRNQVEFVSIEKIKMLDAIVNQTKFLEHQPAKTIVKTSSWKNFFRLK